MCNGEMKKKMCWALHRLSYSKNTNKLRSKSYELVRKIHIENLKENSLAKQDPEKFSRRIKKQTQEKVQL